MPCKINEAADYAEQLKKELTTSIEEQKLPGRKLPDANSPSFDVHEMVTRTSRIVAKLDEGLTSMDSDEEDTGQGISVAYSFESQSV